MIGMNSSRFFWQLLMVLAAFSASITLRAEMMPGTFKAVAPKGEVTWTDPVSGVTSRVVGGEILPQGAILTTLDDSTVVILFGTGSSTAVGQNTSVEVTKFYQESFSGELDASLNEPSVSETQLRLMKGNLTSNVRKLKSDSKFVVKTPVGAAGVRGTTFNVNYNPSNNSLVVSTLEGEVVVESGDLADISVTELQSVVIQASIDPVTGEVTILNSEQLNLTDEQTAAIIQTVEAAQAAIEAAEADGDQDIMEGENTDTNTDDTDISSKSAPTS